MNEWKVVIARRLMKGVFMLNWWEIPEISVEQTVSTSGSDLCVYSVLMESGFPYEKWRELKMKEKTA